MSETIKLAPPIEACELKQKQSSPSQGISVSWLRFEEREASIVFRAKAVGEVFAVCELLSPTCLYEAMPSETLPPKYSSTVTSAQR